MRGFRHLSCSLFGGNVVVRLMTTCDTHARAVCEVLLAAEEHPRELHPLILRKFKQPGDCEAALA